MVLTFALGTHPPGVAAEGFDDAFPLTWKTRAANGDNGFIPTARSGHCTFQAADMSGFYMFG